jgi:outer membrane protein assembly factor BamB
MRSLTCFLLLVCGCGDTGRFTGLPDSGGGNKDGFVFPDVDLATMVCAPGSPPICDGTSIANCNADGSGYDYTPCTVGCSNGVCTCNPGDVVCMGNDVYKCDNTGTSVLDHSCTNGTMCVNGTCGDQRCSDEMMSTNPHALPTDAWPRFRHDNRNTGSTPAVVAAMPKLKWKTFIGGTSLNGGNGLAAGPVVNQNNIIFIGGGEQDGMQGSYYSLDATGKKLWTFAANRGYGISTPAVRADGYSYFSTTTQTLFAIDPKGMLAWSYPVSAQADADPIVTRDGNLIYGDDDGSLYAMDAMGNKVWTSDPGIGPGEVDGGVAESCDGKIYVGGARGWFQLDAMTGKTNWMVPATGARQALLSSPYVTADGTMYGFDTGGQGIAIDKTGKVLWQVAAGPAGNGCSPGKVGNQLFVVLNDGALHALDATTGKNNWTQPVGNGSPQVYLNAGPVTDGNNHIYFNSADGNVYAFDTTGKQLWKIPAGGVNAQPTWSGTIAIGRDGTLYVPGNDGTLYAFQ